MWVMDVDRRKYRPSCYLVSWSKTCFLIFLMFFSRGWGWPWISVQLFMGHGRGPWGYLSSYYLVWWSETWIPDYYVLSWGRGASGISVRLFVGHWCGSLVVLKITLSSIMALDMLPHLSYVLIRGCLYYQFPTVCGLWVSVLGDIDHQVS